MKEKLRVAERHTQGNWIKARPKTFQRINYPHRNYKRFISTIIV